MDGYKPQYFRVCRYAKYVGPNINWSKPNAGTFSRYASIAGAGLICLYYLFHPPLVGLEYSKPPEGSYLIIDKNLIEACALFVLVMFPTSHITGLDKFLQKD